MNHLIAAAWTKQMSAKHSMGCRSTEATSSLPGVKATVRQAQSIYLPYHRHSTEHIGL